MDFSLRPYQAPDFDAPALRSAPDAAVCPAPADGVAPEGFHAMSIWPEYFKIGGRWRLAGESRMDCVPVLAGDDIAVTEFRRLRKGDAVYFVHSYSAVDCDPWTIARTEYGIPVTAAVARDNVLGTQFHPEKSGRIGLAMLSNFCRM